MQQQTTKSRDSARLALGVLILGLLIAVAAVWFFLENDDEGGNARATVADIADDPGEWVGKVVIVSGPVRDVILLDAGGSPIDRDVARSEDAPSGLAFTMGGDALDEQVLVVDAGRPAFQWLTERSTVEVAGTVRDFDLATFDEAFGGTADGGQGLFSGGPFDDWDGRPVIVAYSVDPTVPATDAGE